MVTETPSEFGYGSVVRVVWTPTGLVVSHGPANEWRRETELVVYGEELLITDCTNGAGAGASIPVRGR